MDAPTTILTRISETLFRVPVVLEVLCPLQDPGAAKSDIAKIETVYSCYYLGRNVGVEWLLSVPAAFVGRVPRVSVKVMSPIDVFISDGNDWGRRAACDVLEGGVVKVVLRRGRLNATVKQIT